MEPEASTTSSSRRRGRCLRSLRNSSCGRTCRAREPLRWRWAGATRRRVAAQARSRRFCLASTGFTVAPRKGRLDGTRRRCGARAWRQVGGGGSRTWAWACRPGCWSPASGVTSCGRSWGRGGGVRPGSSAFLRAKSPRAKRPRRPVGRASDSRRATGRSASISSTRGWRSQSGVASASSAGSFSSTASGFFFCPGRLRHPRSCVPAARARRRPGVRRRRVGASAGGDRPPPQPQ